jgi:hypothetical protein
MDDGVHVQLAPGRLVVLDHLDHVLAVATHAE